MTEPVIDSVDEVPKLDPISPLPDSEPVVPAEGDAASTRQEPIQFSGIDVSVGIALGRIQLFSESDLDIPHFPIDKNDVRSESLRLRNAVNTVIKEMEGLLASAEEDAPTEARTIINLYLQILHDETMISETQDLIGEHLVNAEWALALKMEAIREAFSAIDDEYLAERGNDIQQVCERVQRVLTGRRPASESMEQCLGNEGVILIADDLSPADVLTLRRKFDDSITGLVIETGSATSHTAILARSLEIPTLVGTTGITDYAHTDDLLYLDASTGTATLHPSEDDLVNIRTRIRELRLQKNRLKKLKSIPAVTKDGVAISLYANLAMPEDVEDAVRFGAEGIGLYRSEFLFMNRKDLPTEDEQFEAYRKVARAMKGKSVVIRTMDIGGDKMIEKEALAQLIKEPTSTVVNPALGLRALRFCRSFPTLFDTQLRAILRASLESEVRILLPMVTHPYEIDFARERIAQAMQDLDDRGIKYRKDITLGAMIEVPAAAIWSQPIFAMVDFASLGTNDLIQYTLAVDRNDASVSYLYSPWHPAVLQLIDNAVKGATAMKKPLAICGELAGDPDMLPVLLGIGVRRFSMEPNRLLALKERALDLDCAEITAEVTRIRRMRNLAKSFMAIDQLRAKTKRHA